MFVPTAVTEQLAAVGEHEPRVLIVGAGVAGLTLARSLRAKGLHPVLVERAGQRQDSGYMLGLMPFVDPVLAELGLERHYLEQSVAVRHYRLCSATGAALRNYSVDTALGEFGHYRGIERGRLLELLATGGAPVTFRTAPHAVEPTGETVRVDLTENGTELRAEFDAVIAADGIHSTTRDLVLDPQRVHTHDTTWGGWVTWSDPDEWPDTYQETWGPGCFVGLYPVPGRIGVFVGGPRTDTTRGPAAFARLVRDRLHNLDPRSSCALTELANTPESHYWSLSDVRCDGWTTGRFALLGDAAAGFLPTAGVGAAMAIESAGALARRLAPADRSTVPRALRDYERAQRPRVESAQRNSRQLAALMLRRGRLTSRARDFATALVGVNTALGPIRKLLAQRDSEHAAPAS
ncbi:2-polyprenyl-6-methoxyphenol hydroxylase [Actinopolyspora lacussalsi subsp. righensis]|uniref:2-polyprenyl-6-methoxyphenol hydroxylase n=1 Tax=Actinopolyspora righensis TaxID=995060 RepID=A0A1I6X9V3_9ACTN|nr:NAD(P)/FAD-dependent oxidoreductase [Actinopolyspora righensis]SFT34564.1 2-polyprenyl-6-methoxyphenol hydroxylase [Actinopolyspora righensis]